MVTPTEHWNAIFSSKADSELGWYEKDVSQTLKFLDRIPQSESTTVFLPGAGIKNRDGSYFLVMRKVFEVYQEENCFKKIGTVTNLLWHVKGEVDQ